MQPKGNACVSGAGILKSKPLIETLASGFFVFYKANRAVSQLFEPCQSCGRRLRLTRATITVRGRCGHVAVCKVCARCVEERGLIG